MASKVVYEDKWGEIMDRLNNIIEIRWFDTTKEFDSSVFNEWLAGFVDAIESTGRQRVLVDAVSFQMGREHMDAEWRDANIIPRYNAAGVTKFAFLMPEGMPAIGGPPGPEGPADFPTAYFGRRADAMNWLTS